MKDQKRPKLSLKRKQSIITEKSNRNDNAELFKKAPEAEKLTGFSRPSCSASGNEQSKIALTVKTVQEPVIDEHKIITLSSSDDDDEHVMKKERNPKIQTENQFNVQHQKIQSQTSSAELINTEDQNLRKLREIFASFKRVKDVDINSLSDLPPYEELTRVDKSEKTKDDFNNMDKYEKISVHALSLLPPMCKWCQYRKPDLQDNNHSNFSNFSKSGSITNNEEHCKTTLRNIEQGLVDKKKKYYKHMTDQDKTKSEKAQKHQQEMETSVSSDVLGVEAQLSISKDEQNFDINFSFENESLTNYSCGNSELQSKDLGGNYEFQNAQQSDKMLVIKRKREENERETHTKKFTNLIEPVKSTSISDMVPAMSTRIRQFELSNETSDIVPVNSTRTSNIVPKRSVRNSNHTLVNYNRDNEMVPLDSTSDLVPKKSARRSDTVPVKSAKISNREPVQIPSSTTALTVDENKSDIDMCPLCQKQFEFGLTQIDKDGHIAACFAASSDDVSW